MKHWLFLILAYSISFSAKAQEALSESHTTEGVARWVVKFSPLALLDPFGPTFAVYAEQFLTPQKSLEYEAGYMYYGGIGFKKNSNGYRLRAAYRYYWSPFFQNPKSNWYLAPAILYKQAWDRREQFIWRQNFAYQQNIFYTTSLQTISATLNVGCHFSVGDRTTLDISTGLGYKRNFIKINNLPSDIQNPTIPFTYLIDLDDKTPTQKTDFKTDFFSVALAFKIGYLIQ